MNLNVNLRQLKAFLGVAETCNFTKAAQQQHLSQAALSASIRELETQLRCRLFERTTRSVELTAAGREFLPVAQQVVALLDSSAAQLQRMGQSGVSRLRLGFTPILASNVVPGLLEEFQRRAPMVQVDLVDAGPAELLEQVEADRLDAAFGAFFQKRSGLAQTQIAPATLMLVYSDQFSAIGDRIEWRQVFDYPLIALTDRSPIQQLVRDKARQEGAEIRSPMVVNQLDTAMGMVERGFGVAVFPSFAQAAWRRYAVRASEIYPAVSIDYFRIMKAGKEPGPAVEAITQLLMQQLHHPAPSERAPSA
ncbi:LysR family transcriptional regulator [Ramlibacter sp. AW1]|uniref:LysR family transcriptional regulator n=1 Tax=Ramlibacter aurantiacus TaxID=2801330 RepID=A0A936ZTC8_9BURK|nr:LysR family transcriptional regulator [Ramlibacter aurantiacus]MBL0420254.1 LysR family transcriptional regulator [Ramlibacter aurantiacus]